MTDDEINQRVQDVTEYATGAVTALGFAIRALQEQPGFDQRKFVARMATFQVLGEGREIGAGFHKALDETIALFVKAAGPGSGT